MDLIEVCGVQNWQLDFEKIPSIPVSLGRLRWLLQLKIINLVLKIVTVVII